MANWTGSLDPKTSIISVAQVRDWTGKCKDQWLVDSVNSHIGESTEPTRLLEGAGRLCRLEANPSSANVDVLPWKQADQITGDVLAWADQLSAEGIETIDGLILNRVDRLGSFLDDLKSRIGADGHGAANSDWQSEFLQLCHDRDDIEGLLTLRDRIDHSEYPGILALSSMDSRASFLVGLVGDQLVPSDDVWLLRVSEAGDESWWLAPVRRSE